jgi:hypothetical protein
LCTFLVLPQTLLTALYVSFFTALLIYFGGIHPTMTLKIEDYYSGAIGKVDNIPLIVALPSSLASSVSYQLGLVIQTVMTNPASVKTFRDGGFSDSLKLIYSLRPTKNNHMSPFFEASLQKFVTDCATQSTAWDQTKALKSPKLQNYLLNAGALPVVGMTAVYSPPPADKNGTLMTCDSAQTALLALVNGGLVNITNDKLLAETAGSKYVDRRENVSGTKFTPGQMAAETDLSFSEITNGLLSAQQTGQDFMITMIASQPLTNGIKCGTKNSMQYPECISGAQIFGAQEQTRLDQAAGASIFAKTVVPMMNIIMLLFYLFSPILLIAALMFQTQAIKIMSGYIMFAVWTQSWLPTAMIINYITQLQAADALATVAAGNGITAANMFEFYDTAATRIGLASELFAMTPMLTYALLTGGIQAMTSLAGAMNQKDHFSEKDLAPDVMKTGAIADKSAYHNSTSVQTTHYDNGDPNQFHTDNAAGSAFSTRTIGAQNTAQSTIAKAEQVAAQSQYSDALGHASTSTRTKTDNENWQKITQDNVAFSNITGNGKTSEVKNALMKSGSFDRTEAAQLDGALGLQLSGNKAGISKIYGEKFAKKFEESISLAGADTSKKMAELQHTVGIQNSNGVSVAVAKTLGIQDSRALVNAASNVVSTTNTATDADARSASYGTGKSVNFGALGSTAVKNGLQEDSIIDGVLKEDVASGKMTQEAADQTKARMKNYVAKNAELNKGSNDPAGVGRAAWALEAVAQERGDSRLQNYLIDNNLDGSSSMAQTSTVAQPVQAVTGNHSAVITPEAAQRLAKAEQVETDVHAATASTPSVTSDAEDRVKGAGGPHTGGLVSAVKSKTNPVAGQLADATYKANSGQSFDVDPPNETPSMKQFRQKHSGEIQAVIKNAQDNGVSVTDLLKTAVDRKDPVMLAAALLGAASLIPKAKVAADAVAVATEVAEVVAPIAEGVAASSAAVVAGVAAPVAIAVGGAVALQNKQDAIDDARNGDHGEKRIAMEKARVGFFDVITGAKHKEASIQDSDGHYRVGGMPDKDRYEMDGTGIPKRNADGSWKLKDSGPIT